MTQSKDNDITIANTSIDDSFVIDLSNTYGATTTYQYDSTVGTITIDSSSLSGPSYIVGNSNTSYTIGTDDTIDLSNIWIKDDSIDPDEVAKMCKQYPALEKVWRNFKSVYDMVKQDYEGKIKAGEIDDDDLPF